MILLKEGIVEYALDHTSPESELLGDLRRETDQKLKYSNMLTNRLVGQLLQTLIKLGNMEDVLEIGTFTGYSALTMAEALPQQGRLITLEINERYERIARQFIQQSEYGNKIEIIMGNALDTLSNLKGPFDMAFIDADKANYPAYYQQIKPLIVKGGLIVVDNALWSGSVLEPGEDEQARAVHQLNEMITSDEKVENVLLTVRDGLQLVRKI